MKRRIKTALIGFGAGLSLVAASPLAAQDAPTPEDEAMEEVMGQFAELFPTEPLTPEQEARLPAAQRIVALMIPEGTMAGMMGKMIDDILRPMMELGPPASRATIARELGVSTIELDLTDEQAAELASLFDPAWQERQEREMAVMPAVMRELMTVMEPPMRKAMSELYAIRFSTAELADIEAFFSTETGRRYASESFAMASDPRIMSASMEAMPALLQGMADIEALIAEATADLPERRAYEDLGAAERDRVLAATGFSDEDIRANLATISGDDEEDIEAAIEAAAQEAEDMVEEPRD